MRFYRPAPEAIFVLDNATRLFAWQAPERPEDLAFYASDNQPILSSIAHEGDAWFENVSYDEVRGALPGLPVRLDVSSPPGADA